MARHTLQMPVVHAGLTDHSWNFDYSQQAITLKTTGWHHGQDRILKNQSFETIFICSKIWLRSATSSVLDKLCMPYSLLAARGTKQVRLKLMFISPLHVSRYRNGLTSAGTWTVIEEALGSNYSNSTYSVAYEKQYILHIKNNISCQVKGIHLDIKLTEYPISASMLLWSSSQDSSNTSKSGEQLLETKIWFSITIRCSEITSV